jgi:outer membrane protein
MTPQLRASSSALLVSMALCAYAQPVALVQTSPVTTPGQAASPGFPELSAYLSGKVVTISDVVRIALVTNRVIAHARASYLTSRGEVAEANAALFPTIGSSENELRLNAPVSSTHLTNADPTSFAEPIGARFEDQRIQQRIYSIGASLPIDVSGEIRAAIDEARYQRLATRLDLSRVVNDQVATVKSAFYDVLRGQALRKVAEDDLATAQLRLKDAQSRLEAQVVTKFDVLRAQTDVASALQTLISARNRVEQLYAVLDSAIGIRGDIRLHASEAGAVLEPPEMGQMGSVPGYVAGSPEVEKYIKQAIVARPEVSEADADIKAALEGLRVAARSSLPSLSIGWGYVYAPDAGGANPVYHQWVASALFSVPIYDAGVARARETEAKGVIQNAQASRRDAEDQVTLDVQQALIAVSDAQERVGVANISLVDAHSAYDLANLRYNAGVSGHAGISPLLELSDAQAALTLAESNQVNALYDYNNARSLLARALGQYTKGE